MQPALWKVGDLAEQSGLTVRTLHHYDRTGLLRPSLRGAGGHRLYTDGDVRRLLEIKCLRQLGLSLKEIAKVLDDPQHQILEVLHAHGRHLENQIRRQQEICRRLESLTARLADNGDAGAEDFLNLIKEIEMTEKMEKYYTPEQLETLKKRKEDTGPQRMAEVEQEWRDLIAEVRVEMNKGTDPTSEVVQKLAKRWNALIEEFTGGDAGIRESLSNVYKAEGTSVAQRHGMDLDSEMMAYIRNAHAASDSQNA
jgi:DNA-binding transcriptional MerR regulator